MEMSQEVSVVVWGDFACFTRPECRVERVSYDVPTPSACRGILESILWKSEFRWVMRRVRVLRPIRTIALRRNEVQSKIAKADAIGWMEGSKDFEPLMADEALKGVGRTQRQTIALRDVAYEITAAIHLPGGYSESNPPVKYAEMFRRRVEKGQFFRPPCLGCREFAADFAAEPPEDMTIEPPADRDLGRMLFDVVHGDKNRMPRFFEAELRGGVVEFPLDMAQAYWKEALA
ncbi:MAG: type I-C CRISPR-associated protein Cas5c [Sumerlaeia bacterium]